MRDGNMLILCTRDKDRTSECHNVWIDTSNYMPEMDMMICFHHQLRTSPL